MKTKMNPEVKAKWVAALRSGDYAQGRRQLRNADNAFCCLGVLCNLHAQEHPGFAAKQESTTTYGGKSSFPPFVVDVWAGLPTSKGPGAPHYILSNMNDNHISFSEIADYIEKNL